jgi:hypothetical protein
MADFRQSTKQIWTEIGLAKRAGAQAPVFIAPREKRQAGGQCGLLIFVFIVYLLLIYSFIFYLYSLRRPKLLSSGSGWGPWATRL